MNSQSALVFLLLSFVCVCVHGLCAWSVRLAAIRITLKRPCAQWCSDRVASTALCICVAVKCSWARIHNSEPEGDILLFLTGEEEIEQACRGRLSGLGEFSGVESFRCVPPEPKSVPVWPRSATEGELQESGERRAGSPSDNSGPIKSHAEGKDCQKAHLQLVPLRWPCLCTPLCLRCSSSESSSRLQGRAFPGVHPAGAGPWRVLEGSHLVDKFWGSCFSIGRVARNAANSELEPAEILLLAPKIGLASLRLQESGRGDQHC